MTREARGRSLLREMLEPDSSGGGGGVMPALPTLARDVDSLLDDLESGFSDPNSLVMWLGNVVVKTGGEIEPVVLEDLARQLRTEPEGPVVASFLTPAARSRSLEPETTRQIRESFRARFLIPALHRALRELRKSATEYGTGGTGDGSRNDGGPTDPDRQMFTAMRPGLDEIARYQEKALRALLGGFESEADLLEWVESMELATHGEIPEEWSAKAYREGGAREMLLGSEPAHERARRAFATWFALPLFRKGIRSRRRRAGEVPSHVGTDDGGKFA